MSRSPLLLAGAAALLLLGAGPAFSQEGAPDPVVELCVSASGAAEARLDACNKLLERKLGAEERSAVLTIRGLVFLEMEAGDRALSDLMAAIRQDSTNSSAYYARAIYFARIDDLKLAMADIETAIRMEPEDSAYLALRGDLRHRANDHNGALADYDRAIALDSDDDHLVIDRAMIRVDAGDYAGALADYDKAIALSDKASTQVLRADVLQALERYDEAQKGYEKVIAREPDFPMSYTGRARLHQLRGDRQAAIADLDKALALMPGDPQDYIERGWLLYETSEFTRARADFDHAMALSNDDAEMLLQRAVFLTRIEQLDLAEADILRAAAKVPTSPAPGIALSNLASVRGDWRRAIAEADRSLKLAPKDPDALNQACWVRGEAKRELDRAIDICSRAIAQEPDNWIPLDSRSFVYFQQRNFEKALADADAALARQPASAQTLFLRGAVKLRLGRQAEGEADLAAARKLHPRIDAEYGRYQLL
ncbi:tetratricopeptide repeat protein [Phenylobacterium sp.]|uniref:tetratricopeptide repeat protein n=1 Tax=Phenylobacterium sp. TaxID=1871053 RepID=UPI0035AE7CF1